MFASSAIGTSRPTNLDPSHANSSNRAWRSRSRIEPDRPRSLVHFLIGPAWRLWCPSNPVKPAFRPGFDGLESRTVFSLTPVAPNASFPYTAIVKIEETFPDGERYVGSGVMVDSYHVLTAGHVVYDYDDGGWASQIIVIPDMNGSSNPFGEAFMASERTYTTWEDYSKYHPDSTAPGAYDIGLITLNSAIGNETGWMNYGYDNNNSRFASGTIMNTAGYPASGGYDGLTMQLSTGPIAGLSPDGSAIRYYQSSITTYGGQSGSPIWIDIPADNSRVVYGIHVGGNETPDGLNFATRITQKIFDDLQSWRASDTPPSTPSPTPTPTPAPTIPRVTTFGPVWHSRGGITSIGVNFNEQLNPGSASHRNFYRVLAPVTRRVNGRKVTVFSKSLGIKRVSPNSDADSVRIYLARPHKGLVEVIVYHGLVGANGAVSPSNDSGFVR